MVRNSNQLTLRLLVEEATRAPQAPTAALTALLMSCLASSDASTGNRSGETFQSFICAVAAAMSECQLVIS